MEYDVELKTVPGTPFLMVRRRATLQGLPRVLPEASGVVWDFIRQSGIHSHGRNVAVYLNDRIDVEVGMEVGADDIEVGDVVRSTTPAGLVATTAHIGPYDHLPRAHVAIRRWCDAHQYRIEGTNWEVYGHWIDDPQKLRTDVFYLLSADGRLAS